VKFVEKYIIKECETMVSGLEDIWKGTFRWNRENNDLKWSTKKGHALIAYWKVWKKLVGLYNLQ
jgi:hypothetical protein